MKPAFTNYQALYKSGVPWFLGELPEFLTVAPDFLQTPSPVGFPLIWAVLRPTHGWLPFAPMIDTPKGFSSKMTLEVAARGLKVFTSYKLKTSWIGKLNAFCTKNVNCTKSIYCLQGFIWYFHTLRTEIENRLAATFRVNLEL